MVVRAPSRKRLGSQDPRGFESHLLRQLVKEEFGSPATRARQPIFGSKSNFLPLFREAERQKRAFLNFNLLGI